jgi:hypothetical protein
VEQTYSLVGGAKASSLTVFSGYRFVRRAAARDIPIAIVNRGRAGGPATEEAGSAGPSVGVFPGLLGVTTMSRTPFEVPSWAQA